MARAVLRALGCAVGALVISAPSVAVASPQDLFGYGGRACAMAGLGGAIGDDYAAVYSNPAALSRA